MYIPLYGIRIKGEKKRIQLTDSLRVESSSGWIIRIVLFFFCIFVFFHSKRYFKMLPINLKYSSKYITSEANIKAT